MKHAFENYQLPKQTKRYAAHEWQDYAARLSEFLKAGSKKSSVFGLVRKDRTKAEAIHRYMEQKGIQSVNYFFKVWHNT